MHLFFGNERTVGDTAFECAQDAEELIRKCGIPPEQVHRFGAGDPEASAAEYEAMLRGLPSQVAGGATPSLDIVLLGTGADGHTASLYPGSAQVLQSPGERLYLPAEGARGLPLSSPPYPSPQSISQPSDCPPCGILPPSPLPAAPPQARETSP